MESMSGKQFREARAALGMTQRRLALFMGISQKHVSQLESSPHVRTLYQLAMIGVRTQLNEQQKI